jgi:hypothetical protein
MVKTDYQNQIMKVLKAKLGVRCLEFAHEQCELLGIEFSDLTPGNVEVFARNVEKNAPQYVPEYDAMLLANMIRLLWSIMTKRFEWTMRVEIADGLLKPLRRILEERGFNETVSFIGPGAPHVYEFAKEDDLVSLSVQRSARGKATLVLQSKYKGSEILAIVCDAMVEYIASIAEIILEPVVGIGIRRDIMTQVSERLFEGK